MIFRAAVTINLRVLGTIFYNFEECSFVVYTYVLLPGCIRSHNGIILTSILAAIKLL